MKRNVLVILAIAALVAVVGCKQKTEAPKEAPQGAMPGGAAGGDPHAGIKAQEIPAGAGHKGKVVSTLQAPSVVRMNEPLPRPSDARARPLGPRSADQLKLHPASSSAHH